MTMLKTLWCDLFHVGGRIERDDQGRINWRCSKCGRWSDHPVPREMEREMIDGHLAEFRRRRDAQADRG